MRGLFHGDCIEKLKDISNGCVDLVVTDPPYKVTSRSGYTSAGGMLKKEEVRNGSVFEHNNISIKTWLPELYRVLKPSGHCYIMTNNKNLIEFLKVIDASDFHFVKSLIWAKDNKIMSQMYMSQFEYILFLRKGSAVRINECGTSDLLHYPNKKTKGLDGKPLHDTEKPLGLCEILIKNSSTEGQIVLDPFMGIGTTGLACISTNRNFIGIEKDEKYFNIASNRILKAEQSKETNGN